MGKSSLFDEVNNIYEKNDEITSERKRLDVFMINRFLSFYKDSFLVSVKANSFVGKIPSWAVGVFLMKSITKMNSAPWIKYPKKTEGVLAKRDFQKGELTKKASAFFKCSVYHANQIIEILERQERDAYALFGEKRK